jgi:serine-protein kinase ATM
VFSDILKTIKHIIRTIAGIPEIDPQSSTDMETGDGDGFAPIRTYKMASLAGEVNQYHDVALRCSARICIGFIVLVPILQSASGEPTRDNQLADIIANSDAETFQLLAPCYFDNVRERFLSLGISGLDQILNKFGDLFRQYAYSRCEQLQFTAISCLDSTSHIWVEQPAAIGLVGQRARYLCQWFSKKNKIRTWRVRFSFACFMDRYLDRDPLQEVWSLPIEGDEESEIILASSMLPGLGADEDIRVRLKMAMINARFLSPERLAGEDAITRYALFKEPLCTDAGKYVSSSLFFDGN